MFQIFQNWKFLSNITRQFWFLSYWLKPRFFVSAKYSNQTLFAMSRSNSKTANITGGLVMLNTDCHLLTPAVISKCLHLTLTQSIYTLGVFAAAIFFKAMKNVSIPERSGFLQRMWNSHSNIWIYLYVLQDRSSNSRHSLCFLDLLPWPLNGLCFTIPARLWISCLETLFSFHPTFHNKLNEIIYLDKKLW